MIFLTLLAFFNAYSYILLCCLILRQNRKSKLHRLAAAVNGCFAWWSFCYVFFYSAPTAQQAMFWHRISAFGWIMFCPFAVHFFYLLAKADQKYQRRWQPWLFYSLPLLLWIKSTFSSSTLVAGGIIPARWIKGWTYESNLGTPWPWIYILFVVVSFSAALGVVHLWAKESGRLRFIKQARHVIFLDAGMISIGLITDIIMPAMGAGVPPLYATISILWGIGFYYLIKSLKLMSVDDAATPDLILETVMDPILMLDHDGLIQKCNQATAASLGYPESGILGRPLSDFFMSGFYNSDRVTELMANKTLRNIEIRLKDRGGQPVYVIASFTLAESKLDGMVGVVVNMHDITKLKQVEADLQKRNEKYRELSMRMEKLAHYDALTGLPNRRYFIEQLKDAIDRYKQDGIGFMLAFIDLDGFKSVNDSYGHDIGDLLLKAVAQDFSHSLRIQDKVARIGGDEFVFLFGSLEDIDGAKEILDTLKKSWSRTKDIEGNPCQIGLSVGLSICPDDGQDMDSLLVLADERMYREKVSSNIRQSSRR